jgi:hypothetical protein
VTGTVLSQGAPDILPWVLGTFLGVLLMLELGRRLGRREFTRSVGKPQPTTPIDGAMFGLLGLLIAFTFSGAASRFDARRHQIAEECNEIGTAWLRIELLPAEFQPKQRDLFRRYLDSRLETYRRLPDLVAAGAELARSKELQGEIWSNAVAACDARNDNSVRTLVLGSLNDMIDVVTRRTMAGLVHPPPIVYFLLTTMTMACSFLAGYTMAGHAVRPWVHMLAFAVVLSLTTFAIIDIEYPRVGFIQINGADQMLHELRQEMDAPPAIPGESR